MFAEELYTNLIGRQDPIDAAVAEARKAVYSEVDAIEWATPVLFVRDPDVELFRFDVRRRRCPRRHRPASTRGRCPVGCARSQRSAGGRSGGRVRCGGSS